MNTALITGASSGFGKAIAQSLDAAGYQLIILARRRRRLEELAESLSKPAHIIASDITDRDAIKQAMSSLPDSFKEIDVLVNNAGLALGLDTAENAEWDDWQTMIETNVMALSFMTRQVLPSMVDRGAGLIINLGSMAGTYPYRGANVYGATKAFVEHFSLNLRTDLYDKGIRVTNLTPGLAGGTEFSNVRFHGDDASAGQVYVGCEPLQPEDVANTVAWVVGQPPHVNITQLEIMPTCQAGGGFSVHKP